MTPAHDLSADPDCLILTFVDPESPGLAIGSGLTTNRPTKGIARAVDVRGWRNGDAGARLASLADEVQAHRRLICLGEGQAGHLALLVGRLLGARACLALAPGHGSGAADLDDLAAVYGDSELWIQPQHVELVLAADSLAEDRQWADRLMSTAPDVQCWSAELPRLPARLALAQSGWLAAWLDAASASAPFPAPPALPALWRAAFAHALDLNLADAVVDPDGQLRLGGWFSNLSDRPLDLAAAAAAGVAIGARVVRPGLAGTSEVRSRAGFSDTRLDPQRAMPIEIRIPFQALEAPGAHLSVGLLLQDHLWLDSYGFPAVVIQMTPAADDPSGSPVDTAGAATVGGAPDPSPTDPPAIRADVLAGYQTFLGRPPESEAALLGQLAATPSLWTLVDTIQQSPEACRRQLCEIAGQLPHPAADAIELEASPYQLDALTRDTEAIWRRRGREQPYHSALPHPDHLGETLATDVLEAFYATGDAEVDRFLAVCRRNGVEPDPAWAVLEFGCRVGRLGEAFARRFAGYIGVDLSPDQLAIAEARFIDRELSNAGVALLSRLSIAPPPYDVFFCVDALKACPPPLMRAWLADGLANLRPGGIAYVRLPCFLYDYSFRIDPYIRGRTRKPGSEQHALSQRQVFALFAAQGLVLLETVPCNEPGVEGVSYAFLAQKQSLTAGRETSAAVSMGAET